MSELTTLGDPQSAAACVPLSHPYAIRSGMTTEAWIFMVGLRVVDIGALVVWLIWFYRQCDDADGDDNDDFRGGDDQPDKPPAPRGGGPAVDLPLPHADPWPKRRRDHDGDRSAATPPSRRLPARRPAPARVARPDHERV